MTTPRVIELPEDDATVERLYEHAINANDADVGQVYTVEDDPDHAGHKRGAFKDSGTDPGVSTGTPSNLALTLSAGAPIIIDAWPSDPTRIHEFNVSPVSLNLGAVGAIRVECPIIVAGPEGARIAIRGLRFVGAEWEYLDADSGPFVAADAVNESDGVILAALGAWVEIDAAYLINNVQVEVVAYGGDDATPGVVGDVYVFTASADVDTVPPSVTPPPDVPSEGLDLFCYWPVTEGTGQTVDSKDPSESGNFLVFGDDISPDIHDPSWFGPPRCLVMTSGPGFGEHDFASFNGLPSMAAGSAFFMETTVSATYLSKHLVGVDLGGSVNDHKLSITSAGKLQIVVLEDSGGGTNRTAVGATSITPDQQHFVGWVHDGTSLKVYLDPIDGMEDGSVACGPADDPGGRSLLIGCSAFQPTTHIGPDSMAAGDMVLYVGASVPSPAQIAELYAKWKLIYSLP